MGEMRFTPPLISSSSFPCFSFELLDWPPCNCLSSSQPEMSCGLKRKVRQVKQGKPDNSRSGQLLQQHIFVGTTRAFEAAFNQRRVKKRNAECTPLGSRCHHEQQEQLHEDRTQREVRAHLPLLLHLVPVQPVLLPPGHSDPLSVLSNSNNSLLFTNIVNTKFSRTLGVGDLSLPEVVFLAHQYKEDACRPHSPGTKTM